MVADLLEVAVAVAAEEAGNDINRFLLQYVMHGDTQDLSLWEYHAMFEPTFVWGC